MDSKNSDAKIWVQMNSKIKQAVQNLKGIVTGLELESKDSI